MAAPGEPRTLEQAIGEMTVLWNHCQATVFAMFSRLLGAQLSKAQSVFFSINNDRGQRRATQALLDFSSSTFASKANKIIERFNDLGTDRNAFIHAIWDFPEGSDIAIVWRNTGKRLSGKEPIAECDRLISDLEKLRRDLDELEEELRTNAPPVQGELGLEQLVKPVRQGSAQSATQANQVRQQSDAQSLPQQQQPSGQ
jgi:hypothetical protein